MQLSEKTNDYLRLKDDNERLRETISQLEEELSKQKGPSNLEDDLNNQSFTNPATNTTLFNALANDISAIDQHNNTTTIMGHGNIEDHPKYV